MLPKTLVRDEWLVETDDWGDRVKLFRDYYDGNHRSKLTGNMKRMLRISGDAHDQFNENYCGLVVDTYADRLLVERMQGDSISHFFELFLLDVCELRVFVYVRSHGVVCASDPTRGECNLPFGFSQGIRHLLFCVLCHLFLPFNTFRML
jgi:hypothetical protein